MLQLFLTKDYVNQYKGWGSQVEFTSAWTDASAMPEDGNAVSGVDAEFRRDLDAGVKKKSPDF